MRELSFERMAEKFTKFETQDPIVTICRYHAGHRGKLPPMKVWNPNPRDDYALASLAQAIQPFAEVLQEAQGLCDVLIEGRPTEEHLERIRPGGAVIVPFAGVPTATLAVLRSRPDLSLHNLHHNAPETAETAIALLLACSRRIPSADAYLRRGDWTPRYTPEECLRLSGRTALILGMGHIGLRVANVCRALEMSVIGVTRSGRSSNEGIRMHPVIELREVLPEADVLMLALPQTSETEGLIGLEELDRLRKPALLVNIARAQIVIEADLYTALSEGALHAAGLDVWYRYPKHPEGIVPGYFEMPEEARHTYPSAYPFHELSNVVMSPHRGGSSADAESARIAHLTSLLKGFSSPSGMGNRVSLSAGY